LVSFLKIIGAIVIIYFILQAVVYWQNSNENNTYKKLERVCGVILEEQSNNISLYDSCMNRGTDEFIPPDNSSQ